MTTIEGIPFAESTNLKVTDEGCGILGPTVALSHMAPVFPNHARQVLVISLHWSPPLSGAYPEIRPNLVQVLTISALILLQLLLRYQKPCTLVRHGSIRTDGYVEVRA